MEGAVNESWLSSILFLISGLLLFPPIKTRLEKISPVLGRTSIQLLLFFIIFVVGGFNMKWSTEKSLPGNQSKAVTEKETASAKVLENEFRQEIKANDSESAAKILKKLRKLKIAEPKLSKYEKQLKLLKDKERQKTLNEKYKSEIVAFNKALSQQDFKEAKGILSDMKDDDPDFIKIESLEGKLIKALSKKQSKDIRKVYALLKSYKFEAAEEIISVLEDSDIDQTIIDKINKEKLRRINEKELKETLKLMATAYKNKDYREVYSLSEDMLELFPKHKKVNWYHRNSKKEENKLVEAKQKTIENWGYTGLLIGLIIAFIGLPGKSDSRTKSGYKKGEEGDSATFNAGLSIAAIAVGISFFVSFVYGKLFLL